MDIGLGGLWELVMDREAWPAASPWGHKELDTNARLNLTEWKKLGSYWNSLGSPDRSSLN